MPDAPHVPVLPAEVLAALVRPQARSLLDGTVGAGGHSALLLEALPEAELLGLDRDPTALELARTRLSGFGPRVRLARGPFAEAARLAAEAERGPFDAILLDVGLSSMQVDQAERGFSFQREGPLDMRMDPDGPLTARDLLETLDAEALADLIYELGEERHSRRIARAIVAARAEGPLQSTTRLAEVVRRAVPGRGGRRGKGRGGSAGRRRPRIDPATRTFQALRLAVNDELGQLERALPALVQLLAPEGRLAVISFHSLEDRRVKQFFKAEAGAGSLRILTKKPIQASEGEREANPRARSAKLRVAERVIA